MGFAAGMPVLVVQVDPRPGVEQTLGIVHDPAPAVGDQRHAGEPGTRFVVEAVLEERGDVGLDVVGVLVDVEGLVAAMDGLTPEVRDEGLLDLVLELAKRVGRVAVAEIGVGLPGRIVAQEVVVAHDADVGDQCGGVLSGYAPIEHLPIGSRRDDRHEHVQSIAVGW
jgi:hypothetical protein